MPRFALIVLVLALGVIGCNQQQPVIPTIAQIPTSTFTYTPTFTPTATNTPTFTPTSTATTTASFTPTFTPTLTLTPSDTPTITNTPTATFTFTPTATPTATPTITQIPGPTITLFTADNLNMIAGGTTVLRWQASGDTALLETIDQQGSVTLTQQVALVGEQPVTIPSGQGAFVTYRLTALRQTTGQTEQRSVTITIACQFDWFFGNQYVNSGTCPAAGPALGNGTYQEFDGGLMIWTETGSGSFPPNTVYVLFYQGNQWHAYPNNWNNVQPTTDPNVPQGRVQPTGILGYAWSTGVHNNLPVRDYLNYALAADTYAQRTVQVETNNAAIYIDAPNGRVYRLAGTTVQGTWTQVR